MRSLAQIGPQKSRATAACFGARPNEGVPTHGIPFRGGNRGQHYKQRPRSGTDISPAVNRRQEIDRFHEARGGAHERVAQLVATIGLTVDVANHMIDPRSLRKGLRDAFDGLSEAFADAHSVTLDDILFATDRD